MHTRLRRLEAVALAAKVDAYLLTLLLVASGNAAEANPVMRATAGEIGWFGVGLVVVGAVVALSVVYQRSADRWPRASVWSARALASIMLLDAGINLSSWLRLGSPAVVSPSTFATAVLVSLLAIVAYYRGRVLAAVRALTRRVLAPAPHPDRPLVVALVALVVLSAALAGVPASVFGPNAPAESVDRVAAASALVDDFETGDLSRASKADPGYSVVSDNPQAGTYNLQFRTPGGTSDAFLRYRNTSTGTNLTFSDSYQYYLYYSTFTSSGRTNFYRATDAQADRGPNIRTSEGNVLVNTASQGEIDTGADLSTGVYYKVHFTNMNSTHFTLTVTDTSSDTQILKETYENQDSAFGGTATRLEFLATERKDLGANWSADEITVDGAGTSSTVSGYVTNATDGSAVDGANIDAYDDDAGGSLAAETTTNASGYYSLSLSDANYTIQATNGNDTGTTSVEVSGSDVTGANITIGASSLYVAAASPQHPDREEWYEGAGTVPFQVRPIDEQGRNVTVTLQVREGGTWTDHGSATVENDTVATINYEPDPYRHKWRARLNTTDGRTATSPAFGVNVPGYIRVINGSSGDTVTGTTTFTNLTGPQSSGAPLTFDSQTSDGNISLRTIPEPQLDPFVVWRGPVNATSGYNGTLTTWFFPENRTAVIYPNDAAGIYSQCFELTDETGNYPPSESWIEAQAFIGGSFVTTASAPFGADGEANIQMQDGETYRLIVYNAEGAARSVGSFSGIDDSDGCEELVIQRQTIIDSNATDARYNANASLTDAPAIDARLEILNNKTASNTRLVIYPYQDEANATKINFGSVGTIKHTEPLTAAEANETWVVEWRFTLDGDPVTWRTVLGKDDLSPGIPVPQFWKELIGIITLIIFAGAFGQVRAEIGVLVVSLLAAVLWAAGWLPPEATGGAIALSLIMGGFLYANSKSDEVVQ